MLSHRQLKTIRSLALKKHRDEARLFVAEGAKAVGELMPYFRCAFLGMTPGFAREHPDYAADEQAELTQAELERASFLKQPKDVIAVFRQPDPPADDPATLLRDGLCLALDTVQDPGNLGTIIRLADWFGIRDIFCSPSTADAFAPKAVQATMGALARVRLHYAPLPALIRSLPADVPVYGTFLRGESIFTADLSPHGLVVMGNEGNGISAEVEALVGRPLLIPGYPPGFAACESLNVATAAAIVCAEFRRRILK